MHLGRDVADGLRECQEIGRRERRGRDRGHGDGGDGERVVAQSDANGVDGTKVKRETVEQTRSLVVINVFGGRPEKSQDLNGCCDFVPLERAIVSLATQRR